MTLRPATPTDGDGPFEVGMIRCDHVTPVIPPGTMFVITSPTASTGPGDGCPFCGGFGWRLVPVVRVPDPAFVLRQAKARELLEKAKSLGGAVVDKPAPHCDAPPGMCATQQRAHISDELCNGCPKALADSEKRAQTSETSKPPTKTDQCDLRCMVPGGSGCSSIATPCRVMRNF